MSSRRCLSATSLVSTFFLLIATQCVLVTASANLSEWFWSWWTGRVDLAPTFEGDTCATSAIVPFVDPLRVYTRKECLDVASSVAYQNATEMCTILLQRQNQTQQFAEDNQRLQKQLYNERVKRAEPMSRDEIRNITASLHILSGQVVVCQIQQAKCHDKLDVIHLDLKATFDRQHAETLASIREEAHKADLRAEAAIALAKQLKRELDASIEFHGQSYVTPCLSAALMWSGLFEIFNVLLLRSANTTNESIKWHNLAHLVVMFVEMLCTMSLGVFWFPLAAVLCVILTLFQLTFVAASSMKTVAEVSAHRSLDRFLELMSPNPTQPNSNGRKAKEPTSTTTMGGSPAPSFPGQCGPALEQEGAQDQQPGSLVMGGLADDDELDSAWLQRQNEVAAKMLNSQRYT